MFEQKILSAFIADRSDYDMVVHHIERDELSPMGAVVLELIDDYYSRDAEADKVDIELLQSAISRRFSDIPRHKDQAISLLEEVLAHQTSKVNVVAEVLEAQRDKARLKLVDALLSHEEEIIEDALAKYNNLTEATVLETQVTEEYQGKDLRELIEEMHEDGQWNLAPKSLGNRLKGGLRAGHSVIVAARPERGKTLFGTSMNAGFLAQGAKTLYLGNEDPIPDLIMRLVSCLSGLTEEQIRRDPEAALEEARQYGYDNCVFAGLSPGTLYEVEALVRRHKPDVLLVDQMRNIATSSENNTLRLETVARELRNIARRNNCVVIAMTQVGDSGRDKLILNDGDIDGSNTGIPGACDVMVLIGCDEEYEKRDLRKVNLAKNKRGGCHDSFAVSINRDLSRVFTYTGPGGG